MFVCAECGQRHDQPGYCPADGRPLVATDDPLLGTDVGRYRLASLLGEGGMGRVYLGVQPAIGSRVAVKILSDQCARDPGLLERFFAEAKAVNLIRHESIVSVLDLDRLSDGRPYIVMEFVPGHVLSALVSHSVQPVPLGGLVQVFIEVLSALEAAHQIGIVHRDLKPDNILVTGEGHAKVLDFGIAKLAPGLSHLSPRTATGALLGTPAYMAPEQIGGGAIDPRTDIYAAGVVFYEAVTGRVPFAGETLFDLMRQHLEVPPVPPSRLRPDLPQPLEQVILTALEKHPSRRFQTALAMAEATGHAANSLPPEQWRALVRGGVITGGRASLVKSAASGRRPAPESARSPAPFDRTDLAPSLAPRGSAPALGPDATAAASPRGRSSQPPPIGAPDQTTAASPRGRSSQLPPLGAAGAPTDFASSLPGAGGAQTDVSRGAGGAPTQLAASMGGPRVHGPSPLDLATVGARAHSPSASPPIHPAVSPLGSDVGRARAQPSAQPPFGAPFDRPSEPNPPWGVGARPSEPDVPWAPQAQLPGLTGAPIPRPRDPSSASQTRLAPENRKKRGPIVVAVIISAAIATVIALLALRGGGSPTTDQVASTSTPQNPEPGSSSSSSATTGPATGPAPGSATHPAPTTPTPTAPGPAPNTATGPARPNGPTGPTRGPSATPAPSPSAPSPSTGGVPPIIVGGGSAADHGVHIGPGVTTGPGVIIGSGSGSGTGTKRTSVPGVIDYNPTSFDPVAYLPKAKALARQIYPDAELTELQFYENVLPDGRVDLTLKSSSTSYYEFRSAKSSVFPPTRNATNDDIPCYVMVDVTATSIRARVREDDECKHPLRAAPRCTFAQVWKLSRTKDTIPATIAFLSDGKWFFDHDHAGNRAGAATTTSIEDCR